MTDRPAWQLHAACIGRTAAMFPVDCHGQAEAKKICRACPVQDVCLQWALEHDEKHGCWGGTSEHERVKLRRAGRVA